MCFVVIENEIRVCAHNNKHSYAEYYAFGNTTILMHMI